MIIPLLIRAKRLCSAMTKGCRAKGGLGRTHYVGRLDTGSMDAVVDRYVKHKPWRMMIAYWPSGRGNVEYDTKHFDRN